MKILFSAWAGWLLLLCLLGCTTRDREPAPDMKFTPIPGLGKSTERPQGTPLTLPPGIKLIGKPNADEKCWEDTEAIKNKKTYGSGGMVGLCITLYNSNPPGTAPIIIRIPHGTVWISEEIETQNGLIIKPVAIEVPAGEIVHARLMALCANANRDVGVPFKIYEEQPVVIDHPAINELAGLVAGKKINYEEYGTGRLDDGTITLLVPVQSALWEITKTGKIDDNTRKELAKIPDAR